MARFDVYCGKVGFVLDVQADLLDFMTTRIVVPLLAANRVPQPIRHLNPLLSMEGQEMVMATHLLSTMRRTEMGVKRASLAHEADAITRALDTALQGF